MPSWRRCPTADRARELANDEGGSASLEFVSVGLLLLVPLVYFVVALGSIQGAALASVGAARQAARVYVTGETATEARERADQAIEVALADYGIDAADAAVALDCSG